MTVTQLIFANLHPKIMLNPRINREYTLSFVYLYMQNKQIMWRHYCRTLSSQSRLIYVYANHSQAFYTNHQRFRVSCVILFRFLVFQRVPMTPWTEIVRFSMAKCCQTEWSVRFAAYLIISCSHMISQTTKRVRIHPHSPAASFAQGTESQHDTSSNIYI